MECKLFQVFLLKDFDMFFTVITKDNFNKYEEFINDCFEYFNEHVHEDVVLSRKYVSNIQSYITEKDEYAFIVNKNNKDIGLVIYNTTLKTSYYYKCPSSCNLSLIDLHLASCIVPYFYHEQEEQFRIFTTHSDSILKALTMNAFKDVEIKESSSYEECLEYIITSGRGIKLDRYNNSETLIQNVKNQLSFRREHNDL